MARLVSISTARHLNHLSVNKYIIKLTISQVVLPRLHFVPSSGFDKKKNPLRELKNLKGFSKDDKNETV
ncbi:MAG: hypothetical protein ACO3UU_03105 [Minisyncoccia bacterium]